MSDDDEHDASDLVALFSVKSDANLRGVDDEVNSTISVQSRKTVPLIPLRSIEERQRPAKA